jgi:hypothetical protein
MSTTATTKAQLKAEQLWNGWFGFYSQGVHPESNRQLPAECIADCSGPGPADEAVSFWVDRLGFDGPAWLFRSHLSGYGAWDANELADHEQNRQRVLWIWACDCSESPGDYDYLHLNSY